MPGPRIFARGAKTGVGRRRQRDFYSRRLVYLYTATFPPPPGWKPDFMKINRDFFRATCFSSASTRELPPLDEYSPRLVPCRVPSVCHDLFTNVDKRCWIPADSWNRRKWSMEREKEIYIFIYIREITEFEKDMD